MTDKKNALDEPQQFQHTLVDWFEQVAKPYPWRQTTDPWAILISEIMLQQTQVATVLNKGFFVNFLKQFPSPKELAVASEAEILSAWEGLGYYRRVRNLQKAAIAICDQHHGIFPKQHSKILDLPGVGRYTAGAVASFAYDDPQPIVDANVARIFSRLFDYQERIDTGKGTKQLWEWAQTLLSPDKPRSYNSALMEHGQQTCTNKSPKCQTCVISHYCHTNHPEKLPMKKSAKQTLLIDEFALFAIHPEKGVLLEQESAKNRRAGMWRLPLRSHLQTEPLPLLLKTSYAITHHKVTLRIYQTDPKKIPDAEHPNELIQQWHSLTKLPDLPMPSPFRKALNILLDDYI